MAMELSPNMGAGSKQFGTNCGVFSRHFWMPENVILVQDKPAEFMYSMLDLCATVSCLGIDWCTKSAILSPIQDRF